MNSTKKILITTTCLAATVFTGSQAYANPEGGIVSAGSAVITATGKNLDILQSTDKAVIDWRSFDIGNDEITEFHQPNSSSIAVNRINDSKASVINGQLKANGNLILINQNGLLFGQGSKIDVNGLVATTADIDNHNFMNGNLEFDRPGNPDAYIINNGIITAKEAGLVGFVAPNVVNNGVINANLGRVHLASGDTMTVDMYGDGLMEVAVSDNVKSQLVSNTGTINASGGKIALTASAGKEIANSVINIAGELRAPTASQKNGVVSIYAEGSNAVKNNIAANKGKRQGSSSVVISGTIDVSGKNAREKGGVINVSADNIKLKSGSELNASGTAGGGNILIGGNYQGSGNESHSISNEIEQGANIFANANVNGDGGQIVIWSDGNTSYKGHIEAKGGTDSGNGGSGEVSGKNTLDFEGTVDLTSAHGTTGTLLLDPQDITIQTSAGGTGVTCTAGVCTPDGNTSVLTVAALQAALASSNVTISTGSSGSQNGDIVFANSITWSTANLLLVSANRNVTINSGVTISNTYNTALSTTLPVLLALRADSAGANNGGSFISNSGIIDFSNSTGAVSIFYDRAAYSGAYTAGTQTAKTGWTAPASKSVSTQFTAYQLVNTAADVAAISSGLSGNYAIGKNIAGGGAAFNSNAPIGAFTGILDGQYGQLTGGSNYGITGFTLAPSAATTSAGLFSSNSGSIRNLAIGLNITQTTASASVFNVGALTGTNTGTIANIDSSSIITFTGIAGYVGGIIGYSTAGTLTNLHTLTGANVKFTSVVASGTSLPFAGGVAGRIDSTNVNNVVASNNVDFIYKGTSTGLATVYLGGLAGASYGANTNYSGTTYAEGAVSESYFDSSYNTRPVNSYIGGLLGIIGSTFTGTFSNLYATGKVSSSVGSTTGGTIYMGGLLGYHNTSSAIASTNLHAAGDLEYIGNGINIVQGGLIGTSYYNSAGVSSYNLSYATGNISYTYTGSATSTVVLGGLIGQNYDSISNSYTTGTISAVNQISGSAAQSLYAGGLTGLNYIANASHKPVITSSWSSRDLSYIYKGTSSVAQNVVIGGLLGQNSSSATNAVSASYSTGNISADYFNSSYSSTVVNSNIGGLIGTLGYNSTSPGIVTKSYTISNISNNLSGGIQMTGGLIGYLYLNSSVTDSYSMGKVSYTGNTTSYTGGLVGSNDGSVSTSFATGYVSSAGNTGGLIGTNTGTVTDSYWDSVTTGQSTSAAGTSKTTAELQAALLTNYSGSTWGIIADISYPYLTGIFTSTPQVISGIAYSDHGTTAVAGGTAISGLINGVTLTGGSNYTGANGYYYYMVPNGTISGSSQILTYLTGTTKGLTFVDSAASNITGNSIYGNYLTINSGGSTVSGMLTNLATAQGVKSGVNFPYTNSSGLTMSSGVNVQFNMTATSTNINSALTTSGSGVLYLNSTGTITQSAAINATNLLLTGSGGIYTLNNTGNAITNLAANTGSINFSQNGSFNIDSVSTINGITTSGDTTLTSAGSIVFNKNISAANILVQATGASSDITISSGKVLTATGSNNSLTLVSGRNFINNGGSGSLVASSGRWLVYSTNPSGDTTGSLSNAFRRFSCVYGASCPAMPSTGNGLLYSYTPTITATASGISTVYGDAAPSLVGYSYALTGYLGSDASADLVTGTLTGSTTYAQGNDAGSYNINYASGTLASAMGYALSYANSSTALTVSARTLTATLTGTVSKTYTATTGATLAGNNYNLSNIYNGDNVTLGNYTSGTYNNKNAGSSKNVSVSGLTLAGTKASNYVLASSSINGNIGTITQAALNITGVVANDKNYTGTTTATLNNTSAALSGILLTDSVTLGTGSATAVFADKNVNSGIAVTASGYGISGTDSGNYLLSQPTGLSANIAARSLTVTANDKSMTYADGNTYNGFTSSGLQNGETIGSVTFSTDATTSTSGNWKAGSWGITASAATGGTFSTGNYNISYAGGALSIGQKSLTLDATGVDKVYDGLRTASVTLTDDRVSGDILTRSYSALFDTKNAGTTKSIAVSSLGISGTDAANYVLTSTTDTTTANISARGLTITANDKSMTYADGNTYNGFTSSGLQNGETIGSVTFSTDATTSTSGNWNAGSWNITASTATGGTFTGSNYSITYINGSLNIAQKDLTVTANDKSRYYGDSNPALDLGFSGLVSGDTGSVFTGYSLSTNANIHSNIGNYAISLTGGMADNYNITRNNGNLTVTPTLLTIAANDSVKKAGDANPVFTVNYTGFRNNDNASAVSGLTTTTIANQSSPQGNYAITPDHAMANNYIINYIEGSLTIESQRIPVIPNTVTHIIASVPVPNIVVSSMNNSSGSNFTNTNPSSSDSSVTVSSNDFSSSTVVEQDHSHSSNNMHYDSTNKSFYYSEKFGSLLTIDPELVKKLI